MVVFMEIQAQPGWWECTYSNGREDTGIAWLRGNKDTAVLAGSGGAGESVKGYVENRRIPLCLVRYAGPQHRIVADLWSANRIMELHVSIRRVGSCMVFI
jgi:hypothetical protein